MIDPNQLAAELAADPKELGYAALVESADDRGLAALLNATAGAGAERITEVFIGRDAFLKGILPVGFTLPGLTDSAQKMWDRFLSLARAVESIEMAAVTPLLEEAVAQRLLTAEQAGAIGRRTGSRAEVLFGAGTVITPEQAGAAR